MSGENGDENYVSAHSCEICGMSGLSDDRMREHTRTCHVEGNSQCPFCGFGGVLPPELLLHVNQAHLDYLTPEDESVRLTDGQSESGMEQSSDGSDDVPFYPLQKLASPSKTDGARGNCHFNQNSFNGRSETINMNVASCSKSISKDCPTNGSDLGHNNSMHGSKKEMLNGFDELDAPSDQSLQSRSELELQLKSFCSAKKGSILQV